MQRARRWGWPGLRAAGLAFVLGLGVALGQVPFGLWPVALVALAAILWRVARSASALAAFWTALFAGAGHFALALSWIVQPFFVDPWRHGWMAPFAVVLLAFGLALFWGGAAALAQRFARPLLATALLIAAAEMLRSHVLTGFPWALIGHIWLETRIEQAAALVGAHGMTLATLLAGAGIALAGAGRRPVAGLVVVLGLAAAFGWGTHRLGLQAGPGPGGVVRVVQPAVAQSLKWDRDAARATFEGLLDLTAAPPGTGLPAPALAVWPETAVPYLLSPGDGAALAMGSLGPAVVAGFQRMEGDAAWNSLALFGPGGTMTEVYDKVHLVPFGEYVPFGDLAYRWFGLRAFAAQLGAGYSAGASRRLLAFGPGLGLAVPVICYEAIFAEEIGAEGGRGDWIVQVTNDAWFGTLTGPYQHFALARLRAIEQGLPLVRAANTGISAVVDARGQVVADTAGQPALLGLGARGVLDVALPGVLPPPPYARFGDAPVAALLLAGLCLAAWRGRGRNRA
jgi:apolipoprotein N-acyltransferase